MDRRGSGLDDVTVLPANAAVQLDEEVIVGEGNHIALAQAQAQVLADFAGKLGTGGSRVQLNVPVLHPVVTCMRSKRHEILPSILAVAPLGT
jgi:NAD/NADP transhydrogenase beta subunit